MKSICVYCGSSFGNDSAYRVAAKQLGQAIALAGQDLVYGGGRVGLMGVVADAALEAGGSVIGIMPTGMFPKEIAHQGLTEFHEVRDFAERVALFHSLSDGFVALPGGFGTMEELFQAVTGAQVGVHRKPSIILNIKGYFDPLLSFLDSMLHAGFIREAHRELLLVTEDPKQVPDLLRRYQPAAFDVKDKWAELRSA